VFEFDDTDLDARGREIKRETLVELAEYVNTPVGENQNKNKNPYHLSCSDCIKNAYAFSCCQLFYFISSIFLV
jgi:hypothetical protein